MFKKSVALTSSSWPNKSLQATLRLRRAPDLHTLGHCTLVSVFCAASQVIASVINLHSKKSIKKSARLYGTTFTTILGW